MELQTYSHNKNSNLIASNADEHVEHQEPFFTAAGNAELHNTVGNIV